MLSIEQIDVTNKAQVNEFIQLPFRLYKNCPQWVPPFISDIKVMLDPKKHPFYEHSDAEFFVARRDGRLVARVAAMENRPFNQTHHTNKMQFYLFDAENDPEAVAALFNRVFEWARARGLNEIVGPKGFSSFDGYGIQVEGFEHHQMMTMMNYNYPYYNDLMTCMGFEKEVDFVSCYMHRDNLKLPEKINKVIEIVRKRGHFKVKNFKNKAELSAWADRIGEAYNKTFVNNWEYYPLTKREIQFVLDNLLSVAVPKLIKIITYDDEVVGFLLGFPDITPALQRGKGRLTPWSIVDMLISLKRTKWISLNGVGVLPEYHGRGGNTLLYDEILKTVKDFGFEHLELTQMAETASQIRKDIITVGAIP
ncbi:MAG TPA: GNAT family N-acetyltransferase, partial [Anaerolineaceae bacterium]|nr:GNAT family N-acetyltransferase [Anaerolineaceae bacterium]